MREKSTKADTAGEKVDILRRHLVGKEPVSKLGDDLVLQSTIFHR